MKLQPKMVLIASVVGMFAWGSGCSCGSSDSTGASPDAGTTSAGGNGQGGAGGQLFTTSSGSGGSVPPCVNLECQQVDCAGNGPDGGALTTTLSGTVYDPSGTLPLYNVVVYVPNAPVPDLVDELTCDKCDATLGGEPLVSAITDTHGHFVLENVPVGKDIPLVMQVGKWRRIVTIPNVDPCVDNALTDAQVTRLPKSSAEGHLPRIALTTGDADPFFCLLRRLGIDDSEYGIQGSPARIHFYRGANGSQAFDNGFGASPGATFPDGPSMLWTNGWQGYDIVMLSCEGDEIPGPKDGHRAALRDYLNVGGRAFATHYHYNWFQGDAPADLQSVASFTSAFTSFDDLVDIDTTFPKGAALADWMMFVSGMSPYGQFMVFDGRQHTLTVAQALARIWVTWTGKPEYFSFNAPIGAPEDQQCGRMVFTDIHVSAGAGDPTASFPSACNNSPLTEQEKALIFILFDLSSCLIPDDDPPCPPTQNPCGDPNDPPCNGTCVNGCCEEIPM